MASIPSTSPEIPGAQPGYEDVQPTTPPVEMPTMPDAIDDPSPMDMPSTDGGAQSM